MTNPTQDGEGRENGRQARRERVLELCVFLFLIVPSMIMSFFLVRQGSMGFVLVAVSIILRDLALVSLVLFFLWRNGESGDVIGWRFAGWSKEALLGIVLFVPFSLAAGALENLLHQVGFSAPATHLPLLAERNTGEFLLAAALVGVVALAEETIFRGYLILRFRNATASTAAAVLVSAVIFSLGHGYEGSAGVMTVALMGLVFALIYIWRRSLVAPIVMHFLQDFIGIVLLPLLGPR